MTHTHPTGPVPTRSLSPGVLRRVPAVLLGRRDLAPTRSVDLRELYARNLAMHTEPRHRAPGDASRAPDPLTNYVSPRRTAGEPEPMMVETCNFFAIPVPAQRSGLPDFPEHTETGAIDVRTLIVEQDGEHAPESGGEASDL